MGQDLLFLLNIVPESVVNIFYSIFQRHIVYYNSERFEPR